MFKHDAMTITVALWRTNQCTHERIMIGKV